MSCIWILAVVRLFVYIEPKCSKLNEYVFVCRNLFIATSVISTIWILTKMTMRLAARNKKARIQFPFLHQEKTLPRSIRFETFQNLKNKQWYHCRDWQNSKSYMLLCSYICLKKFMMLICFLFSSDALYWYYCKDWVFSSDINRCQ